MTDLKEQSKEVLEEKELTEEERAIKWMNYVGDEVNALLAIFLPISKEGVIGMKYKPVIVETLETGPVYDDTKAEGVEIRLIFNFEEEITTPPDEKKK